MTRTIIVQTKDLDRNGFNDLMDALQDVPGVYAVTVPNMEPVVKEQLPLWPDEPAEQKLLLQAVSA